MEILILYIVLTIASIWDIKTFKIPNALVFSSMVLGICLSFFENGFNGMFISLLSIVIIFVIFLPIWIFKIMGAGDIKLYMAISSFLGWKMTLSISYYSIIIGALMFMFFIHPKRIYSMFKEFFFLIFYKIPLLSDGNKRKLQFSVPIFIAFILIVHDLLP